MNMAGTMAEDFAGARPVAQHCAELTERGPSQAERAEQLALWSRDLSHGLAEELAQLFSAGKLNVTIDAAETLSGADVFAQIGAVAVNSLLRCGNNDQTALLSISRATAIALTDATFGGDGRVQEEEPELLPRSAAMLAEEFAVTIARVIAASNGSAQRQPGQVLVRAENVARLKPFGEAEQIALFKLALTQGAEAEWQALLALPSDRLDNILPSDNAAPSGGAGNSGPSDGTSGAFASLPMQLDAILGGFELSLDQLERLMPGDELPLAIPRELPLLLDGCVLGHGKVGTIDNHMALRLTRMPAAAGAVTQARAS